MMLNLHFCKLRVCVPAMGLGSFQCRSILLICIILEVGQGHTVLAVGAGVWGVVWLFSLIYHCTVGNHVSFLHLYSDGTYKSTRHYFLYTRFL